MTTAKLPLTVNYRTLLAILWVAPIAAAFALFDHLVLDGMWSTENHFTPEQIVYWTAILTLPHIVASMISFADREYLTWYKKPLIRGLGVSLLLAFIGQVLFGGYAAIFIIACYTMYHNVQQQFGISAMILRMPQTAAFKTMKWFFTIPSALGYIVLMIPAMDPLQAYTPYVLQFIGALLAIGTIFAAYVFMRLQRDAATPKIGLRYFIGNIIALHLSFIMLVTGYGFLTTLISRLIHDLTAYVIYTAHDHNRYAAAPVNPFYALPAKLGMKPAFACVPIALVISVIILMSVKHSVDTSAVVLATLNFMHYYMEGHMWKRGTPHRQHVPFA